MKFRIVAFPLASSSYHLSQKAASNNFRAATTTSVSTPSVSSLNSSFSNASRSILYYYHFQTYPSVSKFKSPPNFLRKGVSKAVEAWNKMGLAPEGNWKRTIYVYGERLMDQIDFEESSLKYLHPPSKKQTASTGTSTITKTSGDPGTSTRSTVNSPTIPLVYPSNFPNPLPNFREIIDQRAPFHRSGFWKWLFISPFMVPFALVPVIPNLPFFFCVWRSWSHHRAWKSADFIQLLLENGVIRTEPNDEFAEYYPGESADRPSDITSDKVPEAMNNQSGLNSRAAKSGEIGKDRREEGRELLLSSECVAELVQRLKLQDRAQAEITKALEQVSVRLEKVKKNQ